MEVLDLRGNRFNLKELMDHEDQCAYNAGVVFRVKSRKFMKQPLAKISYIDSSGYTQSASMASYRGIL